MGGVKLFKKIIITFLLVINVTALMINFNISSGEILLFHLSWMLLYTLIKSSILYIRENGFSEQIEKQMH